MTAIQSVRIIMEKALTYAMFLIVAGSPVFGEETDGTGPRRLVFDDQRIEGKIRRPQMVFIKADDRPFFGVMALQGCRSVNQICENTSLSALKNDTGEPAFEIEGTGIRSVIP